MAVKPGGATDPASRIRSMLDKEERNFQRTFLLAIEAIRDEFTLGELADLLEQGRLEEALERVQEVGVLLGNQYGASLVASAQNTAFWLSTSALTVGVAFDISNDRAVGIMQRNRLRLIQGYTAEQRRATRTALSLGIQAGENPLQQARRFRDSLGLTENQVRAVENYRRLLQQGDSQALHRELRDKRFDRSVQRAIREGEPLSPEQIDRMVQRYNERYVQYRSRVIARTESLRAVHEGTEEMYQQAIDEGQFLPSQLTRTWVTARDERVRSSHARLGGMERPMGETFPADAGPLRFPGDPDAPAEETIQCRCVLSTRISSEPPAIATP